ncbi:MAG: hypothetical protein VBE63_17260 [Lamprobacter sp.]|uniref:hypothetical protein n=1 Tax=Lamprobacter sp. TaxID=3100796 RepID=UPI002B258F84|nr:hypothetical protein [Lamprobacter sp.]MEA3641671.1 hypothetical protein [Lamprobacter sp.]
MKRLTPFFSISVVTSIMLAAGSAFAAEPIGEQATEKYQGLAEDNPDLIDDRGNRLQPQADDPSMAADPAGAEVYPDEIVEGNAPLTPDLENEPPPHSDEAEVYGDLGDQNPDIQR